MNFSNDIVAFLCLYLYFYLEKSGQTRGSIFGIEFVSLEMTTKF